MLLRKRKNWSKTTNCPSAELECSSSRKSPGVGEESFLTQDIQDGDKLADSQKRNSHARCIRRLVTMSLYVRENSVFKSNLSNIANELKGTSVSTERGGDVSGSCVTLTSTLKRVFFIIVTAGFPIIYPHKSQNALCTSGLVTAALAMQVSQSVSAVIHM